MRAGAGRLVEPGERGEERRVGGPGGGRCGAEEAVGRAGHCRV